MGEQRKPIGGLFGFALFMLALTVAWLIATLVEGARSGDVSGFHVAGAACNVVVWLCLTAQQIIARRTR